MAGRVPDRDRWEGCLLGAAIGDALGMAAESTPPSFKLRAPVYRKPARTHPNFGLEPGQYTDDTQLMLLVARLIADGIYSERRYADGLRDLSTTGALRFPDAAVTTACDRLGTRDPASSGVNSTTAGCISIGIPFALAYKDPVDIRERVVKAASVTHTSTVVLAASTTVAILIHDLLEDEHAPLDRACENADAEDPGFGQRCWRALRLADERTGLATALSLVGNDISVQQTVPLAFFLLRRCTDPMRTLTVAMQVGGNTDTIGLVCGACIGAKFGRNVFHGPLLDELEDRAVIETLATRLCEIAGNKP